MTDHNSPGVKCGALILGAFSTLTLVSFGDFPPFAWPRSLRYPNPKAALRSTSGLLRLFIPLVLENWHDEG